MPDFDRQLLRSDLSWLSKQNSPTYKAKLPELKDKEGEFVLIRGTEIVDFFSAYDDAIKAGYEKFGLTFINAALREYVGSKREPLATLRRVLREELPRDLKRAAGR